MDGLYNDLIQMKKSGSTIVHFECHRRFIDTRKRGPIENPRKRLRPSLGDV